MVRLKKMGKVRAIGVCNYNLQQLRQAHTAYPVDSIQLPYSLIRSDIEKNLLPFCIKNQIGVLAYSILERGLLTGVLAPQRQFPEDDQRASMPIFSQENRQQISESFEKLQLISHKHFANPKTVARRGVTTEHRGASNLVL